MGPSVVVSVIQSALRSLAVEVVVMVGVFLSWMVRHSNRFPSGLEMTVLFEICAVSVDGNSVKRDGGR
jgi:hypothetical protein